MEFHLAEPSQDLFQRWVSTEGKWEIGFRQMLFGVRVSMTRIGDQWYTIDYCAADQPEFALLLLAACIKILEQYPEDVNPDVISRGLPGYRVKPINRDPDCWNKLLTMAIGFPIAITCPKCLRASTDPEDVEKRQCRSCGISVDSW